MNPAVAPAELVALQAKAWVLDAMAAELRLYRGFVEQFGRGSENSRLFAPLDAYDALFGDGGETPR